MLGYAREQEIGRRVDLFIPPEFHDRHWAAFNRAVASGRTRNPGEGLRLPAIHRTGDRIESATYPSVSSLTRQWVTKAGVAKDLLALLDSASGAERRGQAQAEAGKLAEYRSLVTSQSGKAIAAGKAALLLAFSYRL